MRTPPPQRATERKAWRSPRSARLCNTAEAGQIMLTPRVYADVEDLAEVEPVGDLELKGLAKPVPAFNLLALKEGAT